MILLLTLLLGLAAEPQAPAPATFITKEDYETVLAKQIAAMRTQFGKLKEQAK